MPDISKLTMPNGIVYDLKDEAAREMIKNKKGSSSIKKVEFSVASSGRYSYDITSHEDTLALFNELWEADIGIVEIETLPPFDFIFQPTQKNEEGQFTTVQAIASAIMVKKCILTGGRRAIIFLGVVGYQADTVYGVFFSTTETASFALYNTNSKRRYHFVVNDVLFNDNTYPHVEFLNSTNNFTISWTGSYEHFKQCVLTFGDIKIHYRSRSGIDIACHYKTTIGSNTAIYEGVYNSNIYTVTFSDFDDITKDFKITVDRKPIIEVPSFDATTDEGKILKIVDGQLTWVNE